MAVDEVNMQGLAGKFKLQLFSADGVCQPRTAYAAADKLINENGVNVLIGEYCSSASIAATQVAVDNDVPMLVPISTADGIATKGGPLVFQMAMQNKDIDKREAKVLLQKFKFKTAAILVENNDFGLSFRDNMRKTLEEAGIKIVLDTPQDRADANWYSTITQIQGAHPDIVIMSISAVQAANFVKQYDEAGLKIPLFSDYPPAPYIFEQQVGKQAAAVGLVRGAFFLSEDPNNNDRQKAYEKAFEPKATELMGHKRPGAYWDAAAYDSIMLLADALKRGAEANTKSLVEAFASTHYEGVLGKYEFDENRQIKPQDRDFYFIKDMPDGSLKVLK